MARVTLDTTPRGQCGVCENRHRPMPVPGPRKGGALPSTSPNARLAAARPGIEAYAEEKTRDELRSHCESTPHVVFTVRYGHEPGDSHRK